MTGSSPPGATPGLELRGLSKRFAARPVVDRLSLQVAEGELLILVGPSGSGKSTVLRMVAGLAEKDEGEILVAGREVGHLPPDQRDIAMVFQSYALFPHMTIEQNLAFGMRARGQAPPRVRERVAAVAEMLGLAAMLERYPRQLSGGERQRVALGRAMLREPRLFLLDEPLSNLDAQLRVQTRAEILRLHLRLQATMVYVTHDQIEALSLGDRVGVLRDGRLEDLGKPERVYRRPRNLFVARFVGSPAMNTFAVRAAPPRHVDWQGHALPVPAPLAARLGAPGRDLIFGVRPEHVCLEGSRWAHAAPASTPITASVQMVEYAGDQNYLELGCGASTLVARVEPDLAVQRGQSVRLWFEPESVHLFDPAGEQSLWPEDGG